MRYLKRVKTSKGSFEYKFNPPRSAIKAGVVKARTFKDGRQARYEVPRLIEKVDAWKRGELVADNIGPKSRLVDIFNHYLNTEHFKSLSSNSQIAYEINIKNLLKTKTKQGKTFGDTCLHNLTAVFCSHIYNSWVKDNGVPTANKWATLFGVLMSYAMSLDLITNNPMSKVKKLKHKPRSEVWSEGQVEKFVETAFTEFRWRSIGILALLCYEWAQRPTDIANLKWDAVDLQRGSVTITQSKRGATVYLPLAKHLKALLEAQNEDLGFQPLVVPDTHRPSGGYGPLTAQRMSVLVRQVKETSGTPENLRIGDLRKSAITEMVSSGVDTSAIMSVTGHKNIQSLNPYLKNTIEAATSALEKRKKL